MARRTLLVVVLALFPSAVLAQVGAPGGGAGRGTIAARVGPLEIEAKVALGLDEVPPGWVAVRVTARPADDLAGPPPEKVVFRLAGRRHREAPATLVAVREEPIARGAALKRLWLYTHVGDDVSELHLSVEDARTGRLLGKPLVASLGVSDPGRSRWSQNAAEKFRVGVISRQNPAALSILRSIQLPNRIEAVPVPLEPEDVPDRRMGLDALDLLVLNDADLARLSPEQLEAIRTFALAGGRLLLSPGADATWLAQPFFRDLLPPGRPRAETRRALAGKRVSEYATVVYDGGDDDGGRRGWDGLGLDVRRFAAGLGEVALAPFDVAGGAVKELGDAGREALYKALFRAYAPRGAGGVVSEEAPGPGRSVRVGRKRLLQADYEAPIVTVSVAALLYVLLVGPVNFFVLRRAGREPLIVATVPAIAILAVILIFVIGSFGAQDARSEVEIFTLRAGQRHAVRERLAAIAPTRARALEFQLEAGEAGIALSGEGDRSRPRGSRLEQGERLKIAGLEVARWETGIAAAESVRDLGGTVRVEMRGAEVAVVNETERTLERVILFAGPDRHEGGPLEPGERAVLQLPPPDAAERLGDPATLAGRTLRAGVEAAGHASGAWVLLAVIAPDPPGEGTPPGAERAALLVVEP